VDARADRLTSSQLRAAKSAIKANRKQHPKVKYIFNINYAFASKEILKRQHQQFFYTYF
jgi:hypothetical protein